jgi:hypothetical protein
MYIYIHTSITLKYCNKITAISYLYKILETPHQKSSRSSTLGYHEIGCDNSFYPNKQACVITVCYVSAQNWIFTAQPNIATWQTVRSESLPVHQYCSVLSLVTSLPWGQAAAHWLPPYILSHTERYQCSYLSNLSFSFQFQGNLYDNKQQHSNAVQLRDIKMCNMAAMWRGGRLLMGLNMMNNSSSDTKFVCEITSEKQTAVLSFIEFRIS